MRILIIFIITLLGFYPTVGEVVESDNSVSVIETADENLWECYDNIPVGQSITMLMYDNGTPVVEDDIILYIKK